jgi:hypothetical protein
VLMVAFKQPGVEIDGAFHAFFMAAMGPRGR